MFAFVLLLKEAATCTTTRFTVGCDTTTGRRYLHTHRTEDYYYFTNDSVFLNVPNRHVLNLLLCEDM